MLPPEETKHQIIKTVPSGLTGVGVVLQRDHELGPLPQAFQEGHHQVADVLCIVGGEGVLVSFDGRQSETLTLQLSSPERGNPAKIRRQNMSIVIALHDNIYEHVLI